MSLADAIHIASGLWVKEAAEVSDLEFLTFDNCSASDAEAGGRRLSLLRLQDYPDDLPIDSDVLAAVHLTRVEPVLQLRPIRQTMPAG
jgi:hypothetical protein